MSQLLTPASLDDLMKERPTPIKKSSEFTKTQKNYATIPNEKVSNVLKSMQEMDDDDATTYLGNFNPPPAPSSAGVQRTVDKEQFTNGAGVGQNGSKKSEPHSMSANGTHQSYELNNLQYAYHPPKVVDTYYQQMVPNYKAGSLPKMFMDAPANSPLVSGREGVATFAETAGEANETLLQKLNYMIHLLEEKQDMKTNSTIEEIIMYCFLGIFIIFIVDSFSRVGKYVR
jgi:hypothetical protein